MQYLSPAILGEDAQGYILPRMPARPRPRPTKTMESQQSKKGVRREEKMAIRQPRKGSRHEEKMAIRQPRKVPRRRRCQQRQATRPTNGAKFSNGYAYSGFCRERKEMSEDLAPLPTYLVKDASECAGKSNEELRVILEDGLSITCAGLIRAAAAVRQLDANGFDFADANCTATLPLLRKIAYGQLVPDAVAQFFRHPSLLGRLQRLSPPEQKRLSADFPIKVAEYDGTTIAFRAIPPSKLTPKQIRQIFASDHLRSEAEQAAWLREAEPAPARRAPKPPYELDARKKLVRINEPQTVTLKQLHYFISELMAA